MIQNSDAKWTYQSLTSTIHRPLSSGAVDDKGLFRGSLRSTPSWWTLEIWGDSVGLGEASIGSPTSGTRWCWSSSSSVRTESRLHVLAWCMAAELMACAKYGGQRLLHLALSNLLDLDPNGLRSWIWCRFGCWMWGMGTDTSYMYKFLFKVWLHIFTIPFYIY
jgi:hypothetical protein